MLTIRNVKDMCLPVDEGDQVINSRNMRKTVKQVLKQIFYRFLYISKLREQCKIAFEMLNEKRWLFLQF